MPTQKTMMSVFKNLFDNILDVIHACNTRNDNTFYFEFISLDNGRPNSLIFN